VRDLRRKIATIVRKVAKEILENIDIKHIKIKYKKLPKYLILKKQKLKLINY